MKHSTLTIAFIGVSTFLFAQPAIDSESFYEPGDEVIGFDVDPSGLDDGADGANQTWDFSQIETQGESAVWGGSIVNPSELNDFDLFQGANVAMVLNDGTIRYWTNNENGLIAMGQGGDHDLLHLSNSNTWLDYPFTFGSAVADDASGTIYGTCRDYNWQSTSESEGVGYGTLILPTGTYENVLKVRSISFTSQVNEEIGLERENSVVEHFWYQPGHRGPLLYMRTWSNNGCPGSNSGAEIVYTVPSSSSDISELSANELSLSVFPNPARDEAHLNIRSAEHIDADIWISDLMGKSVLKISKNEAIEDAQLFDFDLASLQPGVYIVNVKTYDAHYSERLVIQ